MTVTLISPTGNVIGTATSPSPGAPAVLPAVQSSKGGTYKIEISGGPGEYTVEPTLNAYIDPAGLRRPAQQLDRHGHADRPLRQQVRRQRRPHGRARRPLGGGGGGGLVSTDRFSQGALQRGRLNRRLDLIGGLTDLHQLQRHGGRSEQRDDLHLRRPRPFNRPLVTRHDRPDHGPGDDHRPAVRPDLRRVRHRHPRAGHGQWDRSTASASRAGIGTMNTSNGDVHAGPAVRHDARTDRERGHRPVHGHDLRRRPEHGRHLHDRSVHGDSHALSAIREPETPLLIGLAFTGGSLYELGYDGGSNPNNAALADRSRRPAPARSSAPMAWSPSPTP